ncbi:hypothetical protein STENM223S_05276 [Streptomyces tendae]
MFPAAVAVFAALCVSLVAWNSRMPAARGPDAPAGTFCGGPRRRARTGDRHRSPAQQLHHPGPGPHRPHLHRAGPRHPGAHRGGGVPLSRLSPPSAPTPATPTCGCTTLSPASPAPRAHGRWRWSPTTTPPRRGPVPTTPVPVSVLLETARALREGPPPRNDVLFVFTDAEESGLLGAQALVAERLPPGHGDPELRGQRQQRSEPDVRDGTGRRLAGARPDRVGAGRAGRLAAGRRVPLHAQPHRLHRVPGGRAPGPEPGLSRRLHPLPRHR